MASSGEVLILGSDVRLLTFLEQLGELPAEVWLVPPILILGAIAGIGWFRRARLLRCYHAIAKRTGLGVEPKILNPSEVRGSFRGRPLMMSIAGRRRQTLRKRWTRVVVDVENPAAIGLRMWRQDVLDRMIMSMGATEIVVGDEAFDRRFVIQSRDAGAVARIFADAALRRLILQSDIDSVELSSSTLRAFYARSERDPEHAALLFAAVAGLAEAIDGLRYP